VFLSSWRLLLLHLEAFELLGIIVLKNQRPTFNSWKAILLHELALVGHRNKKKYAQQLRLARVTTLLFF
jgi:hypothetical protein